jgi:cell division protein FtsB
VRGRNLHKFRGRVPGLIRGDLFDRLKMDLLRQAEVVILNCMEQMLGKLLRRCGARCRPLGAVTCPDMPNHRGCREGESKEARDRDGKEKLHALQQNTKAQCFVHCFMDAVVVRLISVRTVRTWYVDCYRWDFGLTVALRGICTKRGVAQANTDRHSVMVHWYHRFHSGWRKVATIAAAALAVGLGYHVVFGQNGLTVYQQKRQDERSLAMQVKDLQRENELLKSHVDRLQNDPSAIEHQAREELHYTRPGEVIYTLPAGTTQEELKR